MKKILSMFAILAFVPFVANASDLTDAVANVRVACGGISNEMAHMKTMAGINTAVTGVGTVAGGVALGTGIAKANVDSEIASLEQELVELDAARDLRQITIANNATFKNELNQYQSSIQTTSPSKQQEKISELEQKSKTLGNVRTGTMAMAAATNIAGTVIAGTNKVKGDLQSQINNCIAATKVLANVRMQARMDASASDTELNHAENIISKCSAWETVDLSKIDSRATGAMVSGAIGATTGIAGTITSASANSNAVRNGDADKEKELNTASNVLAGTTTAASGVATIFNATQISAIKRAATVADDCEGALK